jgi:hypothetical protein
MSKKISFGSKPQPKNTKKTVLADEWVNTGLIETKTAETVETTRFTIDIPSELHRKIKSFCALKGVKMKEEIQKLLENYFVE